MTHSNLVYPKSHKDSKNLSPVYSDITHVSSDPRKKQFNVMCSHHSKNIFYIHIKYHKETQFHITCI